MGEKRPVSIHQLPHLSSKDLLGDIWFYRPECQYLREAWLEFPEEGENAAEAGEGDNIEDIFYYRAHGRFSIPASFYVKPPDNPDEYNSFRHFNAVDSVICFNQLAYVALLEGYENHFLPFFELGSDPKILRSRRDLVNMMIAKNNTTFVRPIDPNDFEGWVAVNRLYQKNGLPYMESTFRFMDKKGGLAVGGCRGVIFIQNL
jgi:hypothetical protein